jgi:hypothetical protein
MNVWTQNLLCAALLGSAGLAQADLVTNLGTVNPSAHTSFANAAVTVGTTVVGPIAYNFLDKFNFSLVTQADVASIVATINFTAGPGGPPLFGISDLQVNLRRVLPSSSLLLVSWLTVTTPAPGLQQVVALTPTTLLTAGDYSLEVRGVLTEPGSYSGSLIAMAPTVVPLPAALPLLMLGLGAIGAAGLRRRREPAGRA